MTSKPNNLGTKIFASERSDALRSRDSVVESVMRLASDDTANIVGNQEHQLRGLIQTLRNRKGRFALIFAVCQDIPLRNELILKIRDSLPDQSLFELHLDNEEGGLLDRLFKVPGAPDPLCVYGIENLIPPTDIQKLFPSKRQQLRREEIIQELQLRREYFRKLNRPLVLWLPEYVYEIIGKQAIDFWSWGSGSAYFFTERQTKKTGLAGDVIVTGDSNVFIKSDNVSIAGDYIASAVAAANSLHQLRAPVGDFVGRERELDILISTLRTGGSAGISGISGMGGIGKTELALRVANRMRPDYTDAQLFIDMRGTDEKPLAAADALAECIRAFVGPDAKLPEDVNELVKIYRNCLDGKRALILLDNAADSAQVRPLLPPPGCALLVTSRETLALPGMKRLALEQLQPQEAHNLLMGIAPRTPPDIADQICHLCGYLPLAIRAAGSLLDVTPDLDPAAYVTQLHDERERLKRIGREGVDLDVEASFELSYARLQPETARVFRQLAVFPVTFDARAEEVVCQDEGHAHLSELLRRNLVLYNSETARYRLHDLACLFADSRLSVTERSAVQMRHAEHYLYVLRACKDFYLEGGDAIKNGLALFDAERRNIEAGHEWACQHASVNETAALLCNEYPAAGAYVLELRQHPRERILWLEAALAAARQLYDRKAEGWHSGNLGLAYGVLGEMRRAVEFFKHALIIDREIGDRHGESQDLGNLGIAYAYLGETRRAIEFYEQQLLIAREIGDRRGEGYGLGNLGLAYRNLGETRKTIEFYEESLAIARQIGDLRGESNTLTNLGLAYADLGETRAAIEHYEQSLHITHQLGDRRGEGNALSNLGAAYADLGETRAAIEHYEQSLAIRREIGDRRGESNDLMRLSLAVDKLGNRAQAIALAEGSLKIREEIEDPYADEVRKQLAEWRQS